MEISSNALDIIKEFEGLELKAYIDPVGIPTIGYGTIRYPNGQKVQMGDSISQAEAEAFLKHECDEIAEDVSADLRDIPLSQNQFDALVSFCYNVGMGAFRTSTMRRKLRDLDFAGAAAEFARWNKGTVNGVKQELPGLTRRRASERELFSRTTGGGTPIGSAQSDQDRVVSAKGFNKNAKNFVVAFDKDRQVVEIVRLEDERPDTFSAALRCYPKLQTFAFAPTADPLPDGEIESFSGTARPIVIVDGAPKLERELLRVGMEDSEQFPGNDIREMQQRLTDLGYYTGAIHGVFDALTDEAVREFQADYFSSAEADGKVGPRTWKKLWGEVSAPKTGNGTPGKNYLKLTRTATKDKFGCFVLLLEYFKNGVSIDSLEVCSGAPSKQNFRIGAKSIAMSLEPLPEGKWFIQDIEWADGKDNYRGTVWNNGLGPAKIRLDYKEPGTTGRSAIEFHIDWNRPRAPGTAGCIGIQNIADFKRLVTWLRDTDPRDLFVDWGLGTCPTP